MAVIFNTQFDDNFAAWTFTNVFHTRPETGCNGNPTAYAWSTSANLTQQLCYDTSYSSLAIRFQVAVTHPIGGPAWPFGRQKLVSTNEHADGAMPENIGVPWAVLPFQPLGPSQIITNRAWGTNLWVGDDGSLRTVINASPLTWATTGPGSLPLDGEMHAVQFVFNVIDNAHVRQQLWIDNVEYWDQTLTFEQNPDPEYSCIDGYGYYLVDSGHPQCATLVYVPGTFSVSFWDFFVAECTAITSGAVYGEVELDDEGIVVDYLPCDAPSLADYWREAIITGMSLDAGLQQLTITGQYFALDAVPVVQGPDGTVLAFVILSQTSTQIILGSLNPPLAIGDLACVTITNPCI